MKLTGRYASQVRPVRPSCAGRAGYQAGEAAKQGGRSGHHVLGERGARQARSPGRQGRSSRHVLGGRGARQARPLGR